ncbi:hypothetical protein CM19_00875 [Candidatus Acidianus copahuensis]|uniref:Uncharacterized protein n=2 Tax=Sulfolobaceae TaxID=118883 RepID=A0A031LUR1_9CREN|nr:hypothetical protein CM19_00875 [Candidatus Acidianus copahuensis]
MISVAFVINSILQTMVIRVPVISFYSNLVLVTLFGYIIRKYNLYYKRLWDFLGKNVSSDRDYRRFMTLSIVSVILLIFKLIITPAIFPIYQLIAEVLAELIALLIIIFFLIRFYKYVTDRKIKILLYVIIVLLALLGDL